MIKLTQSPPVTLPAQTTAKKPYHKPSFEVIDLNMESPLLAGSGTPTGKKFPSENPILNGDNW